VVSISLGTEADEADSEQTPPSEIPRGPPRSEKPSCKANLKAGVSAPADTAIFGRRGISNKYLKKVVIGMGLEPMTIRLKVECSTS
jgi:hypothetical protein